MHMKDTSLPKGKHIKDGERYSVITNDMEHCIICGRKRQAIHEIFFGNANRQKSKDWGMTLPLCDEHHQLIHRNRTARIATQKVGQKKFEELYGHEKFMEVFKKNYV